MPNITLPDGSVRSFDHAVTVAEVAASIGAGLAKATLGARLDGAAEIVDLRRPLDADCSIEIVTANSEAGLEVIRHSASHVMADAICQLWPEARLSISPATT